MRKANLSRACFDGVMLVEADLSDADLDSAELNSVDFGGALLSGADFTRAQIHHVDFLRSYLYAAHFVEARIDGASFRQARLEKAAFQDAAITHTDLAGATLKGALLHGAKLAVCDFSSANMEGAQLPRVRAGQCRFVGATGRDVNLSYSRLNDLRPVRGRTVQRQVQQRLYGGHPARQCRFERGGFPRSISGWKRFLSSRLEECADGRSKSARDRPLRSRLNRRKRPHAPTVAASAHGRMYHSAERQPRPLRQVLRSREV